MTLHKVELKEAPQPAGRRIPPFPSRTKSNLAQTTLEPNPQRLLYGLSCPLNRREQWARVPLHLVGHPPRPPGEPFRRNRRRFSLRGARWEPGSASCAAQRSASSLGGGGRRGLGWGGGGGVVGVGWSGWGGGGGVVGVGRAEIGVGDLGGDGGAPSLLHAVARLFCFFNGG